MAQHSSSFWMTPEGLHDLGQRIRRIPAIIVREGNKLFLFQHREQGIACCGYAFGWQMDM